MSRTVAIIHGWAEGPWESKQLRAELKKAEYKVIRDAGRADILVAHSLGCYMLPKDAKAKIIVLNGIPLWVGRPYFISVIKKLILEFHFHTNSSSMRWLANKLIHNAYYILRYPRRSIIALQGTRQLKTTDSQKVFILHNKKDTFSNLEELKELSKKYNYHLMQLPGLHDDIWTNPQPYIDFIKKL